MKIRCDSQSPVNAQNIYDSEFSFVCNRVDYEKDEYNGRCYMLVESCNLAPEMAGALVKKRIKNALYESRRIECLAAIEKYEKWCAEIFG